jgi:hypothetical protein
VQEFEVISNKETDCDKSDGFQYIQRSKETNIKMSDFNTDKETNKSEISYLHAKKETRK